MDHDEATIAPADPGAPGPADAPSPPDTRRRRRTRPGAAINALGAEWELANLGLAPGFRADRERIYDDIMLTGRVDSADVDALACMMLLVNHDLRPDELARVVLAADRAALVDAVVGNLLPVAVPDHRRTVDEWATTALIANGIDPTKVPAEQLAGVLHHLVASGRAAAHNDFCAAGEFDQARQSLIDLM